MEDLDFITRLNCKEITINMGGGVVLCGGSVMAKNFVGGVMIIYKLTREVPDPRPPGRRDVRRASFYADRGPRGCNWT